MSAFPSRLLIAGLVSVVALCASDAGDAGQHTRGQHDMPDMPGMTHGPTDHSKMSAAESLLMGQSSGTAFQPAAWPMPMVMTRFRDWRLMWMGEAFLVATQQSAPRGGDKVYAPNWGMVSAIHPAGRGSIMIRGMVSLEPATITNRRYPLLFQTGETAYGIPLVDAQHPHDLFMELSVQYAHPLGDKGAWNIYYAPVGDPALGPPAYPHRASALEMPQATLGHHWQDSTHIANNVLTAGITYGRLRIEASGFHGREPDENRWNIDWGAMDSWSTRLSASFSKNWVAQVSTGRLHNPEAAHAGDVIRTTASIEHVQARDGGAFRATSFIWGQDYNVHESHATNSVVAETVFPIRRKNLVTGRFEWSQRDELLGDIAHGDVFNVSAFTAGYTRDVNLFQNLQTGIGANVTAYVIDSGLKPYYGSHPWGVNVFIRVRLRAGE
jgi:hypothetical protein